MITQTNASSALCATEEPRGSFAEKVELGKEEFESWREALPPRRSSSRQRLDARGAELRGRDLSGRDLRDFDLSDSDLRNCNLRGANLRGALLHRCDARGATFSEARLSEAQGFETDFSKAIFCDGWMEDAKWERCWFRNAHLRGVHGGGAHFISCDASNARFMGNAFPGASFCSTSFENAGIISCNMRDSRFTGTNFEKAAIWGTNFRGGKFDEAILTWESHDLISAILLGDAGDCPKKRSLAGLIQCSLDWCWEDFLEVEHSERAWGLSTLAWWDFSRAPEIVQRALESYKNVSPQAL